MLMFPALFPTKSELMGMCACAHGYVCPKGKEHAQLHIKLDGAQWGCVRGVSSGRGICSNIYMYVDASERKPETHCLKVRPHQEVF